jgi:hypothetical protein
MQRTIKPKGNEYGRNKGHWEKVSDETLAKRPPLKINITLHVLTRLSAHAPVV